MILTKALILMVLPLIFATGSPLGERSEKIPPKSEIMSRIKRLMQMLRQREYESTNLEKPAPHHPLSSQRRRMLERRRKLEALLERNPGLRTLLKTVLEKRKAEEVKMLQSDACRPGLFYCDDRDSSLNEEDVSMRRAALKKVLQMKKLDAGSYCPPGFFYCPNRPGKGDTPITRSQANEIDQHQRDRLKLLDEMFPKETRRHQQNNREMQDLERVVSLAKDHSALSSRKQTETGKRKVEFVSVPSIKKMEKSDESAKAKTSQGEKLADDLMKSLQDTDSPKISETNQRPANHDEINFDLKQLVELLKESKR